MRSFLSKTFSKLKILLASAMTLFLHLVNLFIFILSKEGKKGDKFLVSIKDKYCGKRCFIIGNGPSLTAEDLNKLQNEITFASNKIYNIFSETKWRPTFYTVFDDFIIREKNTVKDIDSFSCGMKFFRKEAFLPTYKLHEPKCYIHSWSSRKYLNNPVFSQDLKKGVYSIATVTYISLQLAAYMGFHEIYLLGMDNKYANTRNKDGSIVHDKTIKTYFNSNQTNEKNIGATWEMNIAYQCAEDFSRKNGFRIYNATRGGALEVFERVDFDSLFS